MELTTINMPVVALRGLTVFPVLTTSFDAEREISIYALDHAMESDRRVFLVTQKDIGTQQPQEDDLYTVGTVCRILHIIKTSDSSVRVVSSHRLQGTNVKTLPYPGYPTDMQPQIGVALSLAEGTSIVTESIFENRFKYLDELARMGGIAKVEGNTAIITGVKRLTGARVSAPDLRAGAALVIAGLAAEGTTVVDDIRYIQRGYENFDEKLRSLGAEIRQVNSEREARKFNFRVC